MESRFTKKRRVFKTTGASPMPAMSCGVRQVKRFPQTLY
jgi:hypothetical protein